MSVPKNKRSVSKTEFFEKIYKMTDAITQFVIKDFGIKRVTRDLRAFAFQAKMTPTDRATFKELCSRYNIDVEAEYPLWLLDYYREHILRILSDLIDNVTQGNTLYPTNTWEFNLRRSYQSKAIANCFQVKQVMQMAIRNLPVDAEKCMPYVAMIEATIKSLKNWKKSGNRTLRAIQAKEAKAAGPVPAESEPREV
jgi:hypothetical protein